MKEPIADACPFRHPLDQGPDGINRPGLYLNERYHEIRDSGTGVVEVMRIAGGTAKLVTRYDDVVMVLRDPAFSRERALPFDDVAGLDGTLLGLDGPGHSRVRRLVSDHFTPRAIGALRDRIERCTAARLQAMLSSGSSADLVADFALPVALETITDLLGLPEADRTDFYHWSRAFLSHSTLSPQEAEASLFAMYDHLSRLLRHRRETPVGDLLSQIAADGAGLPEHQQVMLPIALLLGGWETVASNIATFTQVLLSHPYGTYDSAWPYRPRPSPARSVAP
ncbi:cytochrome P450 [Planobispora longispora]|uniref:Cytochrome P450 n=1 Tax=Planobispora longispora TaxID=28887 RepID=A0A8J3RPM3_9ACTN|nr:cytochrome P450 [Planobispora longispora]GIH77379.1 hypothetical protein Plo01_38080 [Planobispora longispora]